MPKNEVLNEYLNNIYNKDKNHELIYSKIKKKSNLKKIILNSAAIFITIFSIGVIGTSMYAKRKWDIEYKEFQNRNVNTLQTAVTDAINNDYIQNLDMDYVYQNGIGIKIDSVMITNDHYQMIVNMQIKDYKQINSDTFEFGYAIYDENKNIYNVHERNTWGIKKWNYKKNLSRELGLYYNESRALPKILTNTGSFINTISSNEGNIIFQINLNSYEGFPKSEKIYIRIFGIGFSFADGYVKEDGEVILTETENYDFSNDEWQFEISIPEKFSNRDVIELKFSENIDGFEIEKAELSETGLSLILKHKYPLIEMRPEVINILDKDGNRYSQNGGMSDDYIIKQLVDVNKNDLSNGIYLVLNIPEHNINKKIQLIEK